MGIYGYGEWNNFVLPVATDKGWAWSEPPYLVKKSNGCKEKEQWISKPGTYWAGFEQEHLREHSGKLKDIKWT